MNRFTARAGAARNPEGVRKEKKTHRPDRPDTGLRLALLETRRVRIDPRDGFPWRGLAAGLLCWLVIGLLVALL